MVVGHADQQQLGVGVQAAHHVLHLVGRLGQGPAVDGVHGIHRGGVGEALGRAPELGLDQLQVGGGQGKGCGGEDRQALLQGEDPVPGDGVLEGLEET